MLSHFPNAPQLFKIGFGAAPCLLSRRNLINSQTTQHIPGAHLSAVLVTYKSVRGVFIKIVQYSAPILWSFRACLHSCIGMPWWLVRCRAVPPYKPRNVYLLAAGCSAGAQHFIKLASQAALPVSFYQTQYILRYKSCTASCCLGKVVVYFAWVKRCFPAPLRFGRMCFVVGHIFQFWLRFIK
jgi:hypothetical protein